MAEFYIDEDEFTESSSVQRTLSFESSPDPIYDVPNVPQDESHAQVEVSIKYDGNLKMTISTSLIVNQPTENFMVLPLILSVTKCSFQTTAVVAYMGDVINLCLKTPEEGEK